MIAERQTFADVINRLGGVAPERIRFDVRPGKATVRDLVRLLRDSQRNYELIDGLLVEKLMGAKESFLALELGWHLRSFLELNDLGFLLGADGALEILPDLVRIPDLSFVSWKQRPDRTIPNEPVPKLVPDLAIEILSQGNTREEMNRKLQDYFHAGTSEVWFVLPKSKTVQVHSSPDEMTTLSTGEHLNGGTLLPGFTLAVEKLFAKLKRRKP